MNTADVTAVNHAGFAVLSLNESIWSGRERLASRSDGSRKSK